MDKFLLKAIKIGIILILFTPLVAGSFGLNISEYPKAVFFRSLVEAVFLLYVFLVLINRDYLPKKSILLISLVLFLLVLFITSATGVNFYRSFFGDMQRTEGIIMHVHLLAFFVMLTAVFLEKKEWLNLFKITAAVGWISSMVLILRKLGIVSFYDFALDVSAGTLSNSDFFANYIVLVIFVTIFLLFAERKKYYKIIWLCLIVSDCYALFLSGTRGSYAGIFIGLLFFVFLNFSGLSAKKRTIILIGLLVFCIFVLSFSLNPAAFDKISESNFSLKRLFSILKFDIGERSDLWMLSIAAFGEKPLLGWGFESFSFVYDKYIGPEYPQILIENVMYFDRPHNKVLEVLLYSGIFGFIFYILIFLSLFWMIFKHGKSWDGWNNKPKMIYSSILAGFFISYFCQNIFSFDNICTYLLFFLVAAFVNNNFARMSGVKEAEVCSPSRETISLPKAVLASFAAVCIISVFYLVNLKPTMAAMHFPDSIKYEATDIKRAFEGYKKGISMNTIYDDELRMAFSDRAVFLLENSFAESIKKELIGTLAGIKPFLYENLERNCQRTGDTYRHLARINEWSYIILDKDEKYLDEMENVLKDAMAFNPNTPEFSRLSGELKIIRGEYKEGEEDIKVSCRLGPLNCPDELELYKRIGIAYFKAGDSKNAIKNFQIILDMDYDKRKEGGSNSEEMARFADAVAIMYCRDLNDMENCRRTYERGAEIYRGYADIFKQHLEILINESENK